ncbi:MAG: hypothetical protein ABR603_11690, partial [Pyrinomonadaceae bacterium]
MRGVAFQKRSAPRAAPVYFARRAGFDYARGPNDTHDRRPMFTLIDLLVLLLIAGVCGAIGQAIGG